MNTYRITHHAKTQAESKGFTVADIQAAAMHPSVTYANGRYPNQMRHIRNGLVAVVDTVNRTVVTIYADVIETDLRPDQTDRDALRYGKGRR